MKIICIIISILILFFIGCSSTYEVTKSYPKEELYKDFNNSAKNEKLYFILTNDSTFVKCSAKILNDTVVFYNNSQRDNIVSIYNVRQVNYKNHLRGLFRGSLIGALTGGTLSTLRWNGFSAATTLGALGGAIIGSVIGYIFGYNNIYQFNP